MLDPKSNFELPVIPGKRYFTIGEVSDLCSIKPHVLRYWEQEFPQLKPVKRRGNRRYYQRHEVQLIYKIRELLYKDGFTISGARSQLDQEVADAKAESASVASAATSNKAVDTGKAASNVSNKSLDYLIKDLSEVLSILR